MGFGERAFETLQLQHSDPNLDRSSEKFKVAEKIIWELLANASMWKVGHAHGLAHSIYLGSLLDQPENEGKDSQPGTFGELLRQGTVHRRHTRKEVVRRPTPRPNTAFKKGVLEP